MDNSNALVDQLEKIMLTGDEDMARTFLDEHINEFPQDLKEKILTAIFIENIEQESSGAANVIAFKEDASQALKSLAAAQSALQNVTRVDELKQELNI